MMRTFIAFFVASMIGAGTSAAAEDSYVRTNNVVYAEIHGVAMVMDVFTPRQKGNQRAIVDVISGSYSSDRNKLRDHERAQVFDIFCAHGYTVFAIRPGSISRFRIADMLDHVQIGIRWVKEHAEEYKIDPNQLGLMGASAGGHLACLAAVTGPYRPSPKVGINNEVKATGAFFPVTDLLEFGDQKVDFRLVSPLLKKLAFPEGTEGLADDEIEQAMIELSPARLVTKSTCPMLLIHGDADPLVPLQQSRAMLAALEKHEVPAKLIIKPGGGHPWRTIHEEVRVMADWFDGQLLEADVAKP